MMYHVNVFYFKLWNADVTPNAGTSFTITPKSWFSGLSAGTSKLTKTMK